MLIRRDGKDDYVIEINEARLPPTPGEDDIDSTLEGRRRVP
jgi:hypothetical protein